MNTPPDIDALAEVIASQQQAIEQLREEVSELRRPETSDTAADGRILSRRALFGLAGAGIAGAAVGGTATPAAAGNGEAVLLGQQNTSTAETSIVNGSTSDPGVSVTNTNADNGSAAIEGHASGLDGIGVSGEGHRSGVFGASIEGAGLEAFSRIGIGARVTTELGAHLFLSRIGFGADMVGPPPAHGSRGTLSVDSLGDLYLCTATGDPGRWTRLNDQALQLFPAPQRAFDSRPGTAPTAGPKGRFADGEERTIDLGAATDLPAGATSVLANVTVTGTDGASYAALYASDASVPDPPPFATINWFGTGQTLGNTTTIRVDAAGRIRAYAGRATHLVIDIIGYRL